MKKFGGTITPKLRIYPEVRLRKIAACDYLVADPEMLVNARLPQMQNRFRVFAKNARCSSCNGGFAEKRSHRRSDDCTGHLHQQRLAGPAFTCQQCDHPLRDTILDYEQERRW